jgi:hypothetical protein
MMLEGLGFSDAVAAYLTKDCGIDSLKEIAYLDGDNDVEKTIKGVTSLGGTLTVGTGQHATMGSLFQSGMLQT